MRGAGFPVAFIAAAGVQHGDHDAATWRFR